MILDTISRRLNMSKPDDVDTDGKFVVKIVPTQVSIGDDGMVKISNKELTKFLSGARIDQDAHLILMGSDCGCKCCC
jgi:hypothetical protein